MQTILQFPSQAGLLLSQLSAVLYKNLIWKIRNPLVLIESILIPVAIAICFIVFYGGSYYYPTCSMYEKRLPSVGSVPFISDFICNFNNSCTTGNESYTKWYNSIEFSEFLTDVVKLLTKGPYTTWSGTYYYEEAELDRMLTLFWKWYDNFFPPIYKILDRMNNTTNSIEKLKLFTEFFCRKDNDFVKLLDMYKKSRLEKLFGTERLTRSTNVNDTCKYFDINQKLDVHEDVQNFFDINIKPWINGKIYFVVRNCFQLEIVKHAEKMFNNLKHLKIVLKEYLPKFIDAFIKAYFISTDYTALQNTITYYLASYNSFRRTKSYIKNTTIIENLKYIGRYNEQIYDLLNCFELDRFVKIYNVSDISVKELDTMLAFVEFDEKTNNQFINYTIRLPKHKFYKTSGYRVLDKFKSFNQRLLFAGDFKVYSNGFIILQDMIETGYIELVTNQTLPVFGSSIQHFPYPCYRTDTLLRSSGDQAIFCLVMLWFFQFCVTIYVIVNEKDLRQRKFLNIMSLKNYINWIGWYILEYFLFFLLSMSLVIILYFIDILHYTTVGFLILLFFIYSVALITQAFLLTTLFTNSTLAGIYSGILYVAFCSFQVIILKYEDVIPNYLCYMLSIFCQTALANIMKLVVLHNIAFTENGLTDMFANSINLQSGQLIGYHFIILSCDIVLYFILFWYIDSFYAGKYGRNKPFYFPCTKAYFNFDNKQQDIFRLYSVANHMKINKSFYEPNDTNLEKYVLFDNVTKVIPQKSKYVLNGVSLELCKGQISSILGKKESGKTTIVSIVLGYVGTYDGNVYIDGYEVSKKFKHIRGGMGYVPQNNILWNDLTLFEHIYLFCRIKNVTYLDFKDHVKNLLDKFKIKQTETRKQVQNVDEVVKRKLCLLLAFIGDPKLVIIDQPTYRLYQYFFWDIWEIILNHKNKETCIIITTDSLIEADVLSDRIAILSNGELKAFGSSNFLNDVFGMGYSKVVSQNLNEIKKVCPEAIIEKYVKSLHLTQYDQLVINEDENVVQSVNLFMEALDNKPKRKKKPKEFKFYVDKKIPYLYGYFNQIRILFKHRYELSKNKYSLFIGQFFFPILITSLLMIFMIFTIFYPLPLMTIQPWAMINKLVKENLKTFYSVHDKINPTPDEKGLEELYTTNLGEGGIRCMTKPKFPLSCSSNSSNFSEIPTIKPMNISSCSCATGFQDCSVFKNKYPVPSSKLMGSQDELMNLTAFNISDYILKYSRKNFNKLFGGIEFLIKDNSNDFMKNLLKNNISGKLQNYIHNETANLFFTSFQEYLKTVGSFNGYIRVWFNNKGYISAPAYLNIKNNLLLRYLKSKQNIDMSQLGYYGIQVNYQPIEDYHLNLDDIKHGKVIRIIYGILYAACFSTVSSSLMIFTIEERVNGMKKFKISNNISLVAYWLSIFCFDYCVYAVFSIIFIIFMSGFGLVHFISFSNVMVYLVLFLIYGTAKLTNNYLLSFIFKRSSFGFTTSNALAILVASLSSIISASIDHTVELDPSEADMQYIVHRVFLWLPSYCLSRGLIDLFIHQYNYENSNIVFQPFSMGIAGLEIFSLCVLTIVHFILLIIIEIVHVYFFHSYSDDDVIKSNDLENQNKEKIEIFDFF